MGIFYHIYVRKDDNALAYELVKNGDYLADFLLGLHGGDEDRKLKAPMTSWATVPTTISESAVAILIQMERRVASKASPSQSAANPQTSCIPCPFRT